MNPDGAAKQALRPGAFPDWSPDGGKIAFARNTASGGEIFAINSDGTGERQVTTGAQVRIAVGERGISWSPDGTKLVFSSIRDVPKHDIFVVGSDGTGERRLTTNPALENAPDWGPDGPPPAPTWT
jgi:Tol biopolymer transport system component